jgi:lysophospholipase L1-like esterase
MKCQLTLAVMVIGLWASSPASPVVAGSLVSTVCSRPESDGTLQGSFLYGYGRCLVNGSGQIELISSAAHVGFTFRGRECTVYASVTDASGHNYLQYELDGVYQKKVRVSGNNPNPLLITTTTAGVHTVWIYKNTEATSGPVFIDKITGDDPKPIKRPKEPLIEFIGNSITCGAQADTSVSPCDIGPYEDHHDAYYAYGPRVARALDAEFILSSVSGIGVYRTWNTDGPAMPQVYEKADFRDAGTRMWNFTKVQPTIVSIALGTNDLSNGDGKHQRSPFDSATFVDSYIKFVQLIKSKYPSAQLALLSSPMVHGEKGILLQNCLTAIKAKIDMLYPSGRPVALFFFPPMKARGCGGHPNEEDHAILADELVPFFKGLL